MRVANICSSLNKPKVIRSQDELSKRGLLYFSVVPDPDFWSPIRKNYEIFLDPEPDWMSFLLKPDPDYPKRVIRFSIFLHFVFFLRKFY